jgi:hypothetical protein
MIKKRGSRQRTTRESLNLRISLGEVAIKAKPKPAMGTSKYRKESELMIREVRKRV